MHLVCIWLMSSVYSLQTLTLFLCTYVCVILRVHVKVSVRQFSSKGSIVSYRTFNLLSMKQRVLLVVGDLH